MSRSPRQIHLAAHFPGVNSTTVWTDPASGSQIDFAAFEYFARTAERGFFDYVFLAEGLRLREHKGRVHELDVLGRPNTLAVLAALSAVTDHVGLVGTLSTTFNEPYELARQLATLDHLSAGRAGWNAVTSSDAFHGANFRRGGFLAHADRYERAKEFAALSKKLWDSWDEGEALPRRIRHSGAQFDVDALFDVPRSPQGRPVIVQAGDSADGRDFGAEHAEVIFSLHQDFDAARVLYDDVKGRLAAWGRDEDSLKILPAATFVIGDTDAEARERSREIARQQVRPEQALTYLEQVWGRDLSGYDPDGPLPDVEPDTGSETARGWANRHKAVQARIASLRELSEAEGLSVRELVIRLTAKHTFVGTPEHIASEIDRYVQERATDGFTVVGHLTPHGLDEFATRVVPLLQERGSYRDSYDEGATLRDLLGLPAPARTLTPDAAAAR
ncbi:NtaA/DmoA family FMN-dependent monooxygenase [Microbacterium imperiale]|uniref:Oxygenase n=1 Tax=Microbacterium imperiale TaxID=33884 RepID=A0A9W6HHA3_9MICO|nr:NtaA/DmoA family FMN-dependent monooxygenase [Microbacterium imperiale]MBP2421101.1 FMN-dependent oxidoreductase (nitrilotriacetate monooxygenase family) [Microbacterium imperiale]MDS0199787.1 NtaA/DmoA family FMN-dependent monooxygenase [Microbacterium imperiale]BFE41441.1 NtaA/DmoA family FMN-dependent monooxygenase [Microbacterium imperiale]GLJ80392.1 putative oxygenase [Microbacterium imperiale]